MVLNSDMRNWGKSFFRILLVILVLAVAALFLVQYLSTKPTPGQPSTTTTAPTTVAIEIPATQVVEEKPLADLLDVVREDYPNYPTTQPLDLPAELTDAARIVLNRPVYLDAAGRLWITHEKGKDLADVLKKPLRARTLIVKQIIRYVHYSNSGSVTAIANEPDDQQSDLHQYGSSQLSTGKIATPKGNWDRAVRFGESVLLPNENGYTSFAIGNKLQNLSESVSLKFGSDKHTQPIILTTDDTSFCWAPWDNDEPGSIGAIARTPKGPREMNASTGWFDHLVQLIPLADGNILAVGKTDDGIDLKLSKLDTDSLPVTQDNEKIEKLARKLADEDPAVREKTQRELEALGPSIIPVLEKLVDQMPAEAQIRLQNMLGQRYLPSIASLTPLPGQVKTASRFRDGGCALLLTGGGSYREGALDQTLIPAWIGIHPGLLIDRIPDSLTAGFEVGKYQFQSFGSETLVIDPVLGPRRWLGTTLVTLLSKDLRHFNDFVGIDLQGRWIFRSPTQPGKTLIIDCSLPDINPKLPVWIVSAPEGAGWTSTDWPAVVKDKNRTFVLAEHGWRMIDEKEKEKFISTPPNVIPTVATDSSGSRLELVGKSITGKYNGKAVQLQLSDKAVDVQSIFLSDNNLFLVGNGVVQRAPLIEKHLTGTLEIDGTFTKNIPSTPKRVWQDPAGRIIYVDSSTIWVAFPQGRIPSDIRQLIITPIDGEEEKK